MPTYGDETLHERYQREHADNLARLAKMTPEQIAEMELSFHNQIAELQTQLRLAAGDADEKDRLIEQLKYPQMCREARRADAAEAVKLQRLLMADHRECRPKGEGLMGWAAAALQAQMKELRCAQEPAFPVRVTGSLDEIDAQTWPFINEEARKVGAEEGHIEAYQYERANGGVVVLWNGPRVHAMAVTIRDDLNRTRCIRMLADSGTANAAPVEIEYPTFHAQGMGCGLEDRGITDRYEAMAYGFQEGLDQMAAIIDSLGPLYASPLSVKPAIRIELVSPSPGGGLHIRVWNDLAGLEPGTYELYLPVQP